MKFIKVICFAACMFTGISMSGCGMQAAQNDEIVSENILTETLSRAKEAEGELEVSSQTQQDEMIDEMDISHFKPIRESFIDYSFNVKRSGNKEEPLSFVVTGSYDLNQDGKDDVISSLLQGSFGAAEEITPYLQVNDAKIEFYTDNVIDGEIRVIDLDQRDSFIELAVFDEGPSADPHYKIFRYDGEQLYKLGEIDSGALISGKGKFISNFNRSHFEPGFCSAWYEIEGHEFIQKSYDTEKYLGKIYRFNGGQVFFTPMEEMPETFLPTWDFEKSIELPPGDIKLLDIYYFQNDRTLYMYFVELQNGEKGMLHFWIGD